MTATNPARRDVEAALSQWDRCDVAGVTLPCVLRQGDTEDSLITGGPLELIVAAHQVDGADKLVEVARGTTITEIRTQRGETFGPFLVRDRQRVDGATFACRLEVTT